MQNVITALLLWHVQKCHDDVIKWKHFPRYWPFVRGNSSVTGAWINEWVNNLEAGDLRRHRGHFDVTVICSDLVINDNENNFSSNLNYQRSIISAMVPRLCTSLETLAIYSCINHSVVLDMNEHLAMGWRPEYQTSPMSSMMGSLICLLSGDSHRAVSELQWHCDTWHDDVMTWGRFPHYWTFVGECTG